MKETLLGCLFGAALAAALVGPNSSASAQQPGEDCFAPTSVMALGAPLARTGNRLLHGEPVTIVAIGSSSTQGVGASDRAHSYPSQLARELARRFPSSHVTILNKGVGGEETGDMLARFDRDVFDQHPDLVIWQVGSNEILHRDGNPEGFRRQVLDGVARLSTAKIETILMDAQYAPRIVENPDYGAFNEALRKVARSSKVALLDRFEAMRFWFGSDGQNWARFLNRDKVHMNDMGYRCLSRLLVSLIASDLPPAVATR